MIKLILFLIIVASTVIGFLVKYILNFLWNFKTEPFSNLVTAIDTICYGFWKK